MNSTFKFSHKLIVSYYFRAFSQQDMTPLEAIGVIQCCSHRLNRKITPEDIQSGILKTLLQPEDYLPLKDVSISKTLLPWIFGILALVFLSHLTRCFCEC